MSLRSAVFIFVENGRLYQYRIKRTRLKNVVLPLDSNHLLKIKWIHNDSYSAAVGILKNGGIGGKATLYLKHSSSALNEMSEMLDHIVVGIVDHIAVSYTDKRIL